MIKLWAGDPRVRLVLALVCAIVAFSSVSAFASRGGKQAKIGDNYFRPGKLTIKKGTKVTWQWVGFLRHNVKVSNGPAKFHSRTLVRGSYSHRFRKKGTYKLYCTVHPHMTETIVVK